MVDKDRLGRISEFDPAPFKLLFDPKIDLLPTVHVAVVVTPLNIIHHFKQQTEFAVGSKMNTVKTDIGQGPDDAAAESWRFPALFDGGLAGDTDLERDLSFTHSFKIPNVCAG